MYERNAIVLERYFEKLFGFNEINNLRENYFNYRKLIENFERYNLAEVAERNATEEFHNVSSELSKLQKTQEKLYNKGAKFEYSRYIIFNNIKETPENIERCLSQVEDNISKNIEELKNLGEKFISTIKSYNEKKEILEKCQKEKAEAKIAFEEILEKTTNCYKNISEECVQLAKDFITSENKENKKELTNIFAENGKNERNPFDSNVILNSITVSISIYKIEMDIYITGYDRTAKFLTENDTNTVKLDKHKKFYNDSKIKLDFLNAEKDYLIQFLDNERIAAIYDKKVHRKLMLEACRNLSSDLIQIGKLYDILLKEMAGRFTKKLYKENYNREYLNSLEATSSEAENSAVRTNTVAVMNLNYWRLEGIKRIYEVFDEDVTKFYGRDLSEYMEVIKEHISSDFQAIADQIEDLEDMEEEETTLPEINRLEEYLKVNESFVAKDDLSDVETDKVQITDSKKSSNKTTKIISKYGVLKSSKKVLADAIYKSLQTHEFANKEEQKNNNTFSDFFEADKIDIFAKKEDNKKDFKTVDDIKSEVLNTHEEDFLNYQEDVKESESFEEFYNEADEDSIIDFYIKNESEESKKRKAKDEKKIEEVNNTKNIFKKLVNINSKKNKKEKKCY